MLLGALAGAPGCGSSDSLEEVRRLQAAGEHEAAIEPLRALLETDPDDPEVLYLYGVALASTGRAGLAGWPLRKAMLDPEWRMRAGLTLGSALTSNGAFDDAIEVCEELVALEPESTDALLICANARIGSRRDYEGALADADRILELDPEHRRALVPRAVALLALERAEEAAQVLEALDDLFRDDSLGLLGSPGLCAARATFALEKGEPEIAEQRFDRCLVSFPDDAIVLKEAIEFHDANGRYERSMEIIGKALENSPAAHTYRANLALRLRNAGREEEAIELLMAATELEAPLDAAEGWASLAGFHIDSGRYEEGVEAYEQALVVAPSPSSDLLFALADALVLLRRYERALEVADRMTVAAHRELVRGRVYLEQGDPARALRHLTEGIRLWPNNAIARYYAAVAAERTGDFDRAIEEYRYAIRSGPAETDAGLRLGRIYTAEGNDEMALSVLPRVAPSSPTGLEAALLRLRILARGGRDGSAPPDLIASIRPRARWAPAAVAQAQGVDDRNGPTAALAALRGADRLDLTDPVDAVALEAMIDLLARVGVPQKGLPLVEAGLAAHPDAPVFNALEGRALAASGADAARARAAYGRALELDEAQAVALRGLAELEAEQGDVEQAIALYRRAIEAEPGERSAPLALAEILVREDRAEAARDPLEALLREHPYDAGAALLLARIETGDTQRRRELARRAVRFGGGVEAEAFLEGLGESRSEAGEPAAQQTSSAPAS